jgi:predicted DCC family thiol-disulfide oxidoreductase YuxK
MINSDQQAKVERSNPENKPIVIYDGVCYLCQSSVNFIIARDTTNQFLFSPLQCDFAQSLMAKHDVSDLVQDTFILIKDDKCYMRSDAALEISRSFSGGYRWLRIFKIVPSALRDACYRLIARHRYKIFGKAEECLMPNDDIKSKFIL